MPKHAEDFAKMAETARQGVNENVDLATLIKQASGLEQRWASFELFIVTPTILEKFPPLIIEPEVFSSGEQEFVYPIHDYGFKLQTSKGSDLYTAGMSNCKLFYTIEKIMSLLVERLKTAGVDDDTEVQVGLLGHITAQRKAFEIIINLKKELNVMAINFDPADWGEYYLNAVREFVKKGYGYPREAPREIPHTPATSFRSPR